MTSALSEDVMSFETIIFMYSDMGIESGTDSPMLFVVYEMPFFRTLDTF